MIGILLVTHGNFGKELKTSVEMVLGTQKNFAAISLNPEDDVFSLQNNIMEQINHMDEGQGVIVLVDLFGGSPYNASVTCMRDAHMECVTGVNFPMIIGALENREEKRLEELPKIVEKVAEAGIENVRNKIQIPNDANDNTKKMTQ